MSFTAELLTGLAGHLEVNGIGTYRGDGSLYLANETAIVFAELPQTPDRAIALSDYPVTDDPSLSDSVVGVQIRCRGLADPNDVKTLADGVFNLLHGATAFTVGTVRVVQAYRNSGVPLGQDENRRWETSENYYVTVHRASTNRI